MMIEKEEGTVEKRSEVKVEKMREETKGANDIEGRRGGLEGICQQKNMSTVK